MPRHRKTPSTRERDFLRAFLRRHFGSRYAGTLVSDMRIADLRHLYAAWRDYPFDDRIGIRRKFCFEVWLSEAEGIAAGQLLTEAEDAARLAEARAAFK